MKRHIQHIFACLVVASMMTTACTDNLDIIGYRPSDVICFTATLGDPAVSGRSHSTSGHLSIEEEEWKLEFKTTEESNSRGGLTTSLNGSAGVMGVTGNTLEFSFRGDELTSVSNPVYWKDITKRNFNIYAYAPYDVTTVDATNKIITFQATDEVSSQKDVIVASRVITEGDFNQSIPLTFDHILTAVRFKLAIEGAALTSITVSGVNNQGIYSMETGTWSEQTGNGTYTITSTADGNELLMIPQTLTSEALVTLVYQKDDVEKTLKASLNGQEWKPGKLITYTLHEGTPPTYIYLDLAAADVMIAPDNSGTIHYSGKRYTTATGTEEVTGVHNANNVYYVYQSTDAKRSEGKGIYSNGSFTALGYDEVTYDGKPWRDYITNNTSVEAVIEAWDNQEGTSGSAINAGRKATKHRIQINSTTSDVNLTIDNIYSSYQEASVGRTKGSIAFLPSQNSNLTINMIGDNRLGCVHYSNVEAKDNNHLIFEGTGSLTVADADFNTESHNGTEYPGVETMGDRTYFSNHWCAAIGNNDSADKCYGIIINSGTIFAGTTKAENCTAIGGGGNGYGEVTINGGIVTAVATTTGTAIGGGIGYNSNGGEGKVIINGGNVYAYNFANRWNIPSSAIGGAGTRKANGNKGTVKINAGYVYAYSALGTAIGGGSSQWKKGGDADITISGGTVIAKTGSMLSAGIGGGTGNSGVELKQDTESRDGGNANVTINGPAIVRTGSIGGGGTGNTLLDKIGNATITISDGDIQAQCILAAGSGGTPSFTMTGGTIRNSNTSDTEYLHVKTQGGAVYLEDGTCSISGENTLIENCTAETGGAIYIAGSYNGTEQKYNASFIMTGGTIKQCTSTTDGGAVYLKGGDVTLTGGIVSDNLAQDGNGGGFYITQGNFTMDGATITMNSALHRSILDSGNGGGVYITSTTSDVDVNLLSGNLINNTSDRRGGGICVVMPENKKEDGSPLYIADVVVGNQSGGPDISGNATILEGGGLYVEGAGTFETGYNSRITINNGKLKGNSTTSYVPNEDVVNKGGIVTLNNGDVKSVTVTFHGNGGITTVDGSDTFTQRIVTAANNVLVAPKFSHGTYPNLTVKSWNTRADGQGTSYTQGGLININADINLYAQWGQ